MTLPDFALAPNKCQLTLFRFLSMNNKLIRNTLISQQDGPPNKLKALRNSPVFGHFPQPVLYLFVFSFFNMSYRRRILSFVKDANVYFALIRSCKVFKRYLSSTLDLRWCQEDRITFYSSFTQNATGWTLSVSNSVMRLVMAYQLRPKGKFLVL